MKKQDKENLRPNLRLADRDVFVPVVDRWYSEKNFNPVVYAGDGPYGHAISTEGTEEESYKVFTKKEFRDYITNGLGLSGYKYKMLEDVNVKLGSLVIEDDETYKLYFKKPFVILESRLNQYCLNVLSDSAFKVYLLLKREYEYRKQNNQPNFLINLSGGNNKKEQSKGLMARLGYSSQSGKTWEKFKDILITLHRLGLITIIEPTPRQNKESGEYIGKYWELIYVANSYADIDHNLQYRAEYEAKKRLKSYDFLSPLYNADMSEPVRTIYW